MFNEFFDGFDLAPFGKSNGWIEEGALPKVDISESANSVQVTADLPGLDEKDVDVSLSDNHLIIRGEKKSEEEDKQQNYHWVERSYGSFHRSIPLPAEVDATNVDASFHNGVLKVVLQKTTDSGAAKKIPVRRLP